MLTSARVVAEALGVQRETREKPEGTLYLDFPQDPRGEILTGRITLWQPELDIARLELDGPAPAGVQFRGDQAQTRRSIRLRNLILFSALAAVVIIVFWATLSFGSSREVGAKISTVINTSGPSNARAMTAFALYEIVQRHDPSGSRALLLAREAVPVFGGILVRQGGHGRNRQGKELLVPTAHRYGGREAWAPGASGISPQLRRHPLPYRGPVVWYFAADPQPLVLAFGHNSGRMHVTPLLPAPMVS